MTRKEGLVPKISNGSFRYLMANDGYYVDKTSVIKTLFAKEAEQIQLIARPRRFGKTLSMSMLENFLELNYKNPEDRSRQEALFKGLKVCTGKEYKELRDKFMGRYPVISISLKSVQGGDFADAMNSLLDLLGAWILKP